MVRLLLDSISQSIIHPLSTMSSESNLSGYPPVLHNPHPEPEFAPALALAFRNPLSFRIFLGALYSY
jgi:hypothetical protein